MVLDIKELTSILNSGDFHKLLGKVETDFFDCKKEGYNLKDDKSKYELVKDVSSFANAKKRGFILIGIKTKKSEKHFEDEITSINIFGKDLLNPHQYQSIIDSWITPTPVDIKIEWIHTSNNPKKGIFVIEIPEQPKTRKPYLITRTILESGKRSEIVFGYAERKQTDSIPVSAIELQQILKDGLYYNENLDFRLKAIESILERESRKPSPTDNGFSDIEKRIEKTLNAIGLSSKRSFILIAYPGSPVDLKTLFSSEPDSLKLKLENPPTIRKSGFDLRTLDNAKIQGGKFCRVEHVRRKIIDLYRDGLLVVAFDGSEDFLCRSAPHEKVDLRINPVVLIEAIYTYVLFYNLVIKDMQTEPKKINFRVDLKNFHLNNKKSYLMPHEIGSRGFFFGLNIFPAPDNNWTNNIEIKRTDFNINESAFEILKEIYLYFGIGPEKIPYTKEIEGKRLIDIEKIIAI